MFCGRVHHILCGFVRALAFAPRFNFVVSRHLSGPVHWVTIAGCVHVQRGIQRPLQALVYYCATGALTGKALLDRAALFESALCAKFCLPLMLITSETIGTH